MHQSPSRAVDDLLPTTRQHSTIRRNRRKIQRWLWNYQTRTLKYASNHDVRLKKSRCTGTIDDDSDDYDDDADNNDDDDVDDDNDDETADKPKKSAKYVDQ